MRKATILVVCGSPHEASCRSYALSINGAAVLDAANMTEAEEKYGPDCADVLLHDAEISAEDCKRFAPLALHWPSGARGSHAAIKPIMKRVLEHLATHKAARRARLARRRRYVPFQNGTESRNGTT